MGDEAEHGAPGASRARAAAPAADSASSSTSPHSIVAQLASAHGRRVRFVALESLSLGAAAAAVGVAALTLSLAPRGDAAAWTMFLSGLLCGVPMAATWWVERRKSGPAELARKLDLRLGANGALAAAFELRVRGEADGLALALERRALAFCDAPALRRALPAPGWIWLAPPALGLALAALAPELSLPGASRGAAGVPSGAVSGAGSGPEDEAGRTEALARASSALAEARASAAGAPGAEELAARLEEAASELLATGAASPDDPAGVALREELLARAGELAAGASREDRAQAGRGAAGGGAAASGEAGGAGQGEGADKLLTGTDPERRMVGSNRSTSAAEGPRSAPPGPESVPTEAGTLSGRWWSERHDPVVQAWRRALAARAGR